MLWKLPEIVVSPEQVFGFVTNTLLLAIINAVVIIVLCLIYARGRKLIPGPFQNFVEWGLGMLLGLCEDVAGKKKGRTFFPWVAGIFLYVFLSNLWEIIPGVASIGWIKTSGECAGAQSHTIAGFLLLDKDFSNCITPWLRPPSTDLNFTITIALVSVVATQVYGFKFLGVGGQLGRYFSLREGPIGLVVGLLEAVLELARLVSFSFRLFGNLFAGDTLLLVIGYLLPVVGPIPFYFLELFVGFIQAFVFAMLTLIFMTLGTTGHGGEDAEEEHTAEVAREERLRATEALAAH